ncbi:(2Fe-2S)-binding protein [Herbihabitans rhizosphaerae]|uniref:(2Fe-2S)-binding protein n=1 Tax=Herbihabitans rhizosphaerae TaxID=1872711 RepID=UPI001F5FA58B|nr:(2Fe-2S)-binding protein [Herbihabitans rhizosphaerae]
MAAPVTPARRHYIADSLARVDGLQEFLSIHFGLPDGDGWRRCSDMLADPGSFDSWRTSLGERLKAEYGSAPDRTTAGYVMSWYLSVPAYLAGWLFHHERRVPSVRPEHLAFHLDHGQHRPIGVALLAPEFACLPSDPAAGTPNVTVVPDEHALAALLRGRFAAHATRFVDTFGPTVRFGRRTLWGAATDALDTSLWLAGRLAGEVGPAAADASLVLPDAMDPFTSASTLRPNGTPEWTRRRESCCFRYLVAPDSVCGTCPRSCPKG